MKKVLFSLFVALFLINPVQAKTHSLEDGVTMAIDCNTDNVCKVIMTEKGEQTMMYIDLITGAYITRSYDVKNGEKLYKPGHGVSEGKDLENIRTFSEL